jgi:hypothetical protein
VVLYQLSYARSAEGKCYAAQWPGQLHFLASEFSNWS